VTAGRPPGRRRRTLRTFVFGGMVGGAIAVAAPRLRRGRAPGDEQRALGLGAFEGAPCWHYDRGEDAAESGTTSEP
jgi:hypothetical protein